MNIWWIATIALLLELAVCGVVILKSPGLSHCLVALQMAGLITVLVLLAISQAINRPSFFDLALALALLAFPSGFMFSHFIERWFP
ncbi:MAG TPA: monovalent cation/H+ antiporter complex subunit F [Verrucomicrobiae bacterium]|nr:monovalent cation/H+ antiporter complex subunit F [Verrucomicrobiae bacterium]